MALDPQRPVTTAYGQIAVGDRVEFDHRLIGKVMTGEVVQILRPIFNPYGPVSVIVRPDPKYEWMNCSMPSTHVRPEGVAR
jgi:hypothetical protein